MKYLLAFFGLFTLFGQAEPVPQASSADAAIALALAMHKPAVELLPMPEADPFADVPAEWWDAEIVPAHDEAHDKAHVAETCKCGGPGNCTCDPALCKCKNCVLAKSGWLSYADGYAEAKRTGRPCLIEVTQPACPPCRELERTLATMDLSAFVLIRVDRTQEPGVASSLMTDRVPHLLVIGADGETRASRVAPTLDLIRADLQSAFRPVVRYVPRPLQVSYAAPMRSASC